VLECVQFDLIRLGVVNYTLHFFSSKGCFNSLTNLIHRELVQLNAPPFQRREKSQTKR